MFDCGRCWLFPAVESQSETEQMTVDLGTSSETGSAPIIEDFLDQQEAGPTASSPDPKASHGQWSELATDPAGGSLSADPVGLFVFCRAAGGGRKHRANQPAGGAREGRRGRKTGSSQRRRQGEAPPGVHVCGL